MPGRPNLTSVRPGGFYGWPYSYCGEHIDPRARPEGPDPVARALVDPRGGLLIADDVGCLVWRVTDGGG